MKTPDPLNSLKNLTETVAAIATAAGPAAIGCVRVTGPDTLKILSRVVNKQPDKDKNRTMVRSGVVDASGRIVDEIQYVFYLGPGSYTGEDMAEIFCHGGTGNSRAVLDVLLAAGCKPAGPGEFTKRAFLNSKMDLAEAEAINELVNAGSGIFRAIALDQLRGSLSEYCERIRTETLDILAWYEARIEHPEEDLGQEVPSRHAEYCREKAEEAGRHRKSLERGRAQADGFRCALAGATNTGKSSLFNLLLEKERVIVSADHGTTRDVVSERIDMEGVVVALSDTAGFRDGSSGIDAQAEENARRAMLSADLVLLLFDASREVSDEDIKLYDFVRREGKRFVVVVNKTDLARKPETGRFAGNAGSVEISVKERINIDGLVGLVLKEASVPAAGPTSFCPTERTIGLFGGLETAFGNAAGLMASGAGYDAIALELSEALGILEGAVGRSAGPDLLDRVFSRFCIGK